MDEKQQNQQLGLSQPSFFILISMNPYAHVIGIVVIAVLLAIPITVHAPSHPIFQDTPITELPPPLFDHEKFLIDRNSAIRDIAPALSFNERLQFFVQDVQELFTFNPVAQAELKLQHALERQQQINELDSRGIAIPLEFEERRIQKLTEANEILSDRVVDTPASSDERLAQIIDTFETLMQMGELNDIIVLYSQIPSIINASPEIKAEYNAKVNSLVSWQENCVGEFDVDSLLPLSSSLAKLENQCPKLVELQERFGTERLRLLVSGQI